MGVRQNKYENLECFQNLGLNLRKWYLVEDRRQSQYLPHTALKILWHRLGGSHLQRADQKEPSKDGSEGQMWQCEKCGSF